MQRRAAVVFALGAALAIAGATLAAGKPGYPDKEIVVESFAFAP
jgi:hypothetical protein